MAVGRPPVLLANADWYGTLAAARELGRRNIQVYVASNGWLRQARWSRYAVRHFASPDERDAHGYGKWLVDLGRLNPGVTLCQTSDDISFVHAAHARELNGRFLLATPGLAPLREILDKQRLYEHARRIGLRTPRTIFPSEFVDRVALATETHWPLLIKPRTHVGASALHTGIPVRDAAELRLAYARLRESNSFASEVLTRWPGVDRPMLQEYLPECSGRIYCLAGFVSPDGEHWVTRAALKVLSHPRYLGIGLLFEHAAVLPQLEDRVLQLCRTVGYYGTFQCEFLVRAGEYLLIDFNPRFYNYMSFDHARGMPQAYLAYLLAIGARNELFVEIERARVQSPAAEGMIYEDRLGTWVQLRFERLFRRISRQEVVKWRLWRERATPRVDRVWDRDDVRPAIVDVLNRLWRMARHPRHFFSSNTRTVF
jgi:D-aspartate ligase